MNDHFRGPSPPWRVLIADWANSPSMARPKKSSDDLSTAAAAYCRFRPESVGTPPEQYKWSRSTPAGRSASSSLRMDNDPIPANSGRCDHPGKSLLCRLTGALFGAEPYAYHNVRVRSAGHDRPYKKPRLPGTETGRSNVGTGGIRQSAPCRCGPQERAGPHRPIHSAARAPSAKPPNERGQDHSTSPSARNTWLMPWASPQSMLTARWTGFAGSKSSSSTATA